MADLVKAAKSGDTRATLEALRDKLANTINECDSGRDVAALSRRLVDVVEKLDAMPKGKRDSPLAKAKRGA